MQGWDAGMAWDGIGMGLDDARIGRHHTHTHTHKYKCVKDFNDEMAFARMLILDEL